MPRAAGGGDFAHGAGVGGELGIVRGAVGPGRAEVLVPDWRQEDEAGTGRDARDHVEQPVVIGLEAREPRFPLERARHAVGGEDDGRLRLLDLADELIPTLAGRFASRLQETEAKTRVARRGVTTPAKIAERDGAIGKPRGQHELDPPMVLLALGDTVTDEDDAIAGA